MVHFLHFFSPTVAPQVRPYWFPFPIEAGQRIFWPNSLQVQASVDVQRYDELVFACRVEGRPKAEVMWTINGLSPGDVVQNFTVNETLQGRSVLIVDITDDNQKVLFSNQMNVVQCMAANDAGMTLGSVALTGSCEFMHLDTSAFDYIKVTHVQRIIHSLYSGV